MSWDSVGAWIKDNAGNGASLVGSLLTGNVTGAVAAGVAMVSSATGTNDPEQALAALQNDPASIIRLKEIAADSDASIRSHLESMTALKLNDKQEQHKITQSTIKAGDIAEDAFVRRTRPAQSWCSLFAAFIYVFIAKEISLEILLALLALPWTYAGLRQIGKGIDSVTNKKK